ncbi:hypothetical protein FGIG_06404 [Fasciola gigantica]|uniref:Uncharacterized protein n=1 Tax=Fasciola gigantica TaxID=46835 RepID=A0A504YK38_FASGI|nr:hypothetical protein FGIG_06404 [Fasciola gigantica]
MKVQAAEVGGQACWLLSVSTGQDALPTDWKAPAVVAIPNDGPSPQRRTYRPARPECVPLNCLENLLRENAFKHPGERGLLSEAQSGFNNTRPCPYKGLGFLSEQQTNGWSEMVFLDFSKAL